MRRYWHCRRCDMFWWNHGLTPSQCHTCGSDKHMHEIPKDAYVNFKDSMLRSIKYRMVMYHETTGEAVAALTGLPIVEYGGTDPKHRGD